jgi:UDP-N-acetylglucosamine acyltransferase
MGARIHPLAHVAPTACLGDEVVIGPFCVIGPEVVIGDATELLSHVTIVGKTVVGRGNRIFPGAVIGMDPQDISYDGSPTRVEIGDFNVIREGVTINRATTKEDGVTRVGNYNYLMACCHVAHDCKLGNHVILANSALLGGHVHVQDYAIISGNVAIHHYATVGRSSFVGGQSRIVHDVPPFMLVDGNPSWVRCVNVVGLRRQGMNAERIAALTEAHRLIYRARMGLDVAEELLRNHGHWTADVAFLFEFLRAQYAGRHGRAREALRKAA